MGYQREQFPVEITIPQKDCIPSNLERTPKKYVILLRVN